MQWDLKIIGRCPVRLLAFLLLAGCTVGPDYKRPEVRLPEGWINTVGDAAEVAGTPGTGTSQLSVVNALRKAVAKSAESPGAPVAAWFDGASQTTAMFRACFPYPISMRSGQVTRSISIRAGSSCPTATPIIASARQPPAPAGRMWAWT